jgi:hypothetical protein
MLIFRLPLRGFCTLRRFCTLACLTVASWLCAVPLQGAAQTSSVFTFAVRMINPGVVFANEATNISIGGSWEFGCPPTVLNRSVDIASKRISFSLVPSEAPCLFSGNTWETTLTNMILPLGTYEISVDVKIRADNQLRVYAQAGTFINVEARVNKLPFVDARLLTNPGATNHEQLLSVTHVEGCPRFNVQSAITRNGGAVEVRLAYANPPIWICPATGPPPAPVTNVFSLGQLPAGTYDVNVDASVGTGSLTNLARLPLAVGNAVTPPASATGAWYDPSENGWGLTMVESNGIVFATWYVFNSNRQPLWYVMPAGRRTGATIQGEIYTSNGSDLRLQWQPDLRLTQQRGTAYIHFKNEQSASVTSVFDNTFITRNVTRLLF